MSDASEDVPEAAVDPSTKDILGWIGKIVYLIAWPIGVALYYFFYYLAFVLAFLVKLVYEPLAFIFAPLFYLGQFLLSCLLAPLRFLAKFETLYIYLSIGALIGITGGLLLSLAYSSLQKPLGLDSQQPSEGRTAKEYRKEKRARKAKAELPASALSGNTSTGSFSLSEELRKGRKGKGLLAQTIMEEVDSDY